VLMCLGKLRRSKVWFGVVVFALDGLNTSKGIRQARNSSVTKLAGKSAHTSFHDCAHFDLVDLDARQVRATTVFLTANAESKKTGKQIAAISRTTGKPPGVAVAPAARLRVCFTFRARV
jgi:hypothetical protein